MEANKLFAYLILGYFVYQNIGLLPVASLFTGSVVGLFLTVVLICNIVKVSLEQYKKCDNSYKSFIWGVANILLTPYVGPLNPPTTFQQNVKTPNVQPENKQPTTKPENKQPTTRDPLSPNDEFPMFVPLKPEATNKREVGVVKVLKDYLCDPNVSIGKIQRMLYVMLDKEFSVGESLDVISKLRSNNSWSDDEIYNYLFSLK
jgi:hypothetical protein